MVEQSELKEMLLVNEKQKEFYEDDTLTIESHGNLLTRLWRKARRRQGAVRKALGVSDDVYGKHWEWLGDLSDKTVLDLGCYAGNPLSLDIAAKSAYYLGIDLSEIAIRALQGKLTDAGIEHADAMAVDFLSPDFGDRRFDIIYVHGCAHHFRHFEAFIQKTTQHLVPGGVMITADPMETHPLVWLVRRMYRPFQSDADWEWPFTRKTFAVIQKYYDIEALQGMMGHAKWAFPLMFINRKLALKKGQRWHERDKAEAVALGPGLYRCLQVSLKLRLKD